MEFNSQICTSIEQSKRLLELGLKKETADMYHNLSTGITEVPYTEVELQRELEKNDILPAWSLHRLMEIMYNGDMFNLICQTTHNGNIYAIYELVIANIEGLVKIDKFNKDYLEEKK